MSTEENKIAVLFPGQGSQYVGMGRDFLETDPDAGELMEMAETVSSFPLKKLCLEGPAEELTRAAHLQPALTAVNLICWQALKKNGVKPGFLAGHSLGEYSAMSAAGIIDPADAVSLVAERGRLMEREGKKKPGGMRAIIGLTLDEVSEILAGLENIGTVGIANYNSEKQVVISGENIVLNAAETEVARLGGKTIPLQVSLANHSQLMAGAVPDFEQVIKNTQFRPPLTPVFFNVTGRQEEKTDFIRDIVARQIVSTVKWFNIIEQLAANGVRIFIEAGPKMVLSNLIKRILPRDYNYSCYQVENPERLDRCLEGIRKAGMI